MFDDEFGGTDTKLRTCAVVFDSVVAVLDSVTVVIGFCYGGDLGERNSVRVSLMMRCP
jgi:hypothetical protein